jgi:hypothetical protein
MKNTNPAFTMFTLVKWASEWVGTDPKTIREFLTVEGLKGRELPKGARDALTDYRKLSTMARLRRITSLVKVMGLPKNTASRSRTEWAAKKVLEAARVYGDAAAVADYTDKEQGDLLSISYKYAELLRRAKK